MPAVRQYNTIAAAQRNAAVLVPDADVPDAFDSEGLQAISGNFSSVSLRYANETATLTLSVSDITTNATNATSEQRLTADGRDLTYRRFGATQSLSCQCNGYRYSVSGTALARRHLPISRCPSGVRDLVYRK